MTSPEEVYTVIERMIEERRRLHRIPFCVLRLELINNMPEHQAHDIDRAVNELCKQNRIYAHTTQNQVSYYLNK